MSYYRSTTESALTLNLGVQTFEVEPWGVIWIPEELEYLINLRRYPLHPVPYETGTVLRLVEECQAESPAALLDSNPFLLASIEAEDLALATEIKSDRKSRKRKS